MHHSSWLALGLLVCRAWLSEASMCYSCNSGNNEWQNPDCTPDGHVNTETVKAISCAGSCMAKQNKWDSGSIVRGCADQIHMPAGMSAPSDGCTTINGEEVCACAEDNCNVMAMQPYQGEGGAGAGGHGGTVPRSLNSMPSGGRASAGSTGWAPEDEEEEEGGIRCYECTSGTPEKMNPLCPEDGSLDMELVTDATCHGTCMVKQSFTNRGTVLRGCSTHVYAPPDRDLPTDGCTMVAGEEVCFCSEPLCNTMPMTPLPPLPMPEESAVMDDANSSPLQNKDSQKISGGDAQPLPDEIPQVQDPGGVGGENTQVAPDITTNRTPRTMTQTRTQKMSSNGEPNGRQGINDGSRTQNKKKSTQTVKMQAADVITKVVHEEGKIQSENVVSRVIHRLVRNDRRFRNPFASNRQRSKNKQ